MKMSKDDIKVGYLYNFGDMGGDVFCEITRVGKVSVDGITYDGDDVIGIKTWEWSVSKDNFLEDKVFIGHKDDFPEYFI
jgi:hypothetical protein